MFTIFAIKFFGEIFWEKETRFLIFMSDREIKRLTTRFSVEIPKLRENTIF